jgi:hypothetical protein
MGNLAARLLAETQASGARIYFAVDIGMGDFVRRYSDAPIWARGVGVYHGNIVSLGTAAFECSSPLGDLVYPKLSQMTVADESGSLARDLELYKPDGATVNVRMLCPGLPEEDWLPVYGNGVLDNWEQNGREFTLETAFNELPLRSPFPRYPITRTSFKNAADPAIYTYFGLIAYGVHDSRNGGDGGMVPCHYVDTVLGRFGPWVGWITVDRVYLNGELVDASDWTTVHEVIGGVLWTLIQFNTPPAKIDNPEVTADIEGYHNGVDGAGDLIEGANVPMHALANFILPTETWKSGAWNDPEDQLISVAHFEELHAYLVKLGYHELSFQIGGPERMDGKTMLQQFAVSVGAIATCLGFFTPDGKVAMRPNDLTTPVLSYGDLRRLRYESAASAFQQYRHRQNLVDRLDVKAILNRTTGEYQWAINLRDLTVDRNRTASLELPMTKARVE